MRLLKNIKDEDKFWSAIDKCKYDVQLRSADGSETLNLKSVMSRYIAIGKLADEHGDEYEIYCDSIDEPIMLEFFYEVKK